MICKTFVLLGLTGFGAVLASVPSLHAQRAAESTSHATISDTNRDTALRMGRLPNGLTYYVRANSKPEQRAKLLLVVKVGSLQEDDDQLGLAHFLEHMAFNGTRRFKHNDLVKYLESIGVKFGADLNASTSWERTMYEIQVPTTDSDHLLKALDIMSDWTDGITMDSADVADERGVIIEEWRARLNQGAHLQAAHDSVMFNGARYGRRLPIGTFESIQSATPERLKRFYRDWYRPNLMAVVVVGDIDPREAERAIVERFSHLKNPVPERPLELSPVPDNTEPLFSLVQDSLIPSTVISVSYKVPKPTGDRRKLARESLAFSLFQGTVNRHFAELARVSDPPFRSASVGIRTLTPDVSVFSITVGANSESPLSSAEFALAEVERIAQHGVSDAVLEEAREGMQKSAEKAAEKSATEDQSRTSNSYAFEYASQFVSGDELVDAAEERRIYLEALALVTNDDIKKAAKIWHRKENRVFLISAPSRGDVRVPDLQSLLSVVSDVERMTLEPYNEVATRTDPLLPELPEPGKIVARKTLDAGVTEWTLSNGIRVLLRPSSATSDMFAVTGESRGGYYRNLDSVDFVPASLAMDIMNLSGSGTFNAVELRKAIRNKEIGSLRVNVDPYLEVASVTSTVSDAEAALQLLYLVLRYPRIDTAAVETYRSQMRAALTNRIRTAELDYRDTVMLTMSQHHPLVMEQLTIDPDKIDAEKSLQVFRDRFADMSDFRFVIVGNFQLDLIEPLIERYLASLPGHGRTEDFVDVGIRAPDGIVRKTVSGAKVDRTTTQILFFGPSDDDRATGAELSILQEVIQARLVNRLREQLSGVYTPSVSSQSSRLPTPSYSLQIQFASAPERAAELVAATMEVLRDLRTNPVSEAEIANARERMLLFMHQGLKLDQMWALNIHVFDDLKLPFSQIPDDSFIRNITPAQILKAAQRFITLDRYAHFDLVPDQNVGQP